VEILKALYRGAELLVLDEPTAVLTDIEVEGLYGIIDKLRDEGKSIIFISHKMREVLRVSDRITILRAGEAVCTLEARNASGQELASLMIGRELCEAAYGKAETPGEPVIELKNVDYNRCSRHGGLSGVSLRVGRGEILGVAGVDGNGQSQLAQVVTGIIAPEAGKLFLKGKKPAVFSPRAFIDEHVSHIPEDRNLMGLVGEMSVEDNLVFKSTESGRFSRARGWLLKKRAIRQYSEKLREKYDIRCRSVEQETRNLSGGNQQKVILARELEAEPELLIAVHPTRGLDIGATRYVRDCMIEARDQGCAVLLISADFDEVLQLSDRIVVMFEGRIMGEYSGKCPPIQDISLAMAGK
jgi:simple sugar transport system ATP-binding protein